MVGLFDYKPYLLVGRHSKFIDLSVDFTLTTNTISYCILTSLLLFNFNFLVFACFYCGWIILWGCYYFFFDLK